MQIFDALAWIMHKLIIFQCFAANVHRNGSPVGRPCLSWTHDKLGSSSRSVRVYGLFGGKKDDKDSGDDSSSKVGLFLLFWNKSHPTVL